MKTFMTAIYFLFIVKSSSETPASNDTAKYDPAELLTKIFTTNSTILPRGNYGLVQFDGPTSQTDFVNYETQNNLEDNNIGNYANEGSVKFEDHYEPAYNNNAPNVIKFEEPSKDGIRKKKRRKRKPRQHYGLQNPGDIPYQNFGPGNENGLGHYPPFAGQYYTGPPRRPRPSLASEALSAVTGALTSIAQYDDYQCVPRLLCEAAAGGALGSSGILQTVSGLQPLLTLLSAYNGVSGNPLVVFGRAALLGAAADSGASCRYAYPLCPADPEQLVHYLNNHNGGFFRFFNAPQQGTQNVEQFYNQLSQNLYEPNQDQNGHQPTYGLYNFQPNYGYERPGLYSNYKQNYGHAYPYQNSYRFKNNDNLEVNTNKIEKRIQNKPNTLYINELEDENPRWTFPEGNVNTPVNYVNSDTFNTYSSDDKNIIHNDQNDRIRYYTDNRKGKNLKFPEAIYEGDYLQADYDENRVSFFPQNDKNLNYNTLTNDNYYNRHRVNKQYSDYNTYNGDSKYVNNQYNVNKNNLNYNNDNYVNKNNYNNYNRDLQEGVQTVYVVRGNGDPNTPEVYKLRPGQTIQ